MMQRLCQFFSKPTPEASTHFQVPTQDQATGMHDFRTFFRNVKYTYSEDRTGYGYRGQVWEGNAEETELMEFLNVRITPMTHLLLSRDYYNAFKIKEKFNFNVNFSHSLDYGMFADDSVISISFQEISFPTMMLLFEAIKDENYHILATENQFLNKVRQELSKSDRFEFSTSLVTIYKQHIDAFLHRHHPEKTTEENTRPSIRPA